MEVIVIEQEAYKNLIFKIDELYKIVSQPKQESDRWLSPEEAARYTGFKPAWIKARSEKIGAFKDGCGLRYKKSDIDAYMQKHFFKSR